MKTPPLVVGLFRIDWSYVLVSFMYPIEEWNHQLTMNLLLAKLRRKSELHTHIHTHAYTHAYT